MPKKSGTNHKFKGASDSPKTKNVKITHHHAKPYKRSHIGSLGLFIVIGIFLIVFGVQYNAGLNRAIDSAQIFVSGLFNYGESNINVSSSYGFQLSYDQLDFIVGGVDSTTGSLFIGEELSTKRAYEQLRISRTGLDTDLTKSSMTIMLDKSSSADDANSNTVSALEYSMLTLGVNTKEATLTKTATTTETLDNKTFIKNNWSVQSKEGLASKLPVTITTYLGALNGHPFVIKANNGVSTEDDYKSIIDSLKFSSEAASSQSSTKVASKIGRSSTFLNSILFTNVAKAGAPDASKSEKISSLFSPAVVKIYNLYCMGISINGAPYLNKFCNGGTGSGFLVGSDGYVATNGHVATSSPKDVVIQDALYYLSLGDPQYFNFLAELGGVKATDFTAESTENDVVDAVANAIYELEDDIITADDKSVTLLVGLNEKQPDIEELMQLTEDGEKYSEQTSIKIAKEVASDFRAFDGIVTFRGSDVAILKISGSDYPVVNLGSVASLTQGSEITILGYPGNASNNGLVDSTESKVTLTAGKVSAIKNAQGSDKKLVETDTTIGHGNSGGPAIDDQGLVFGLATYTSDGAGQGDGTFNYIRDIKDLKDLAEGASITFNTESKTQEEWKKGIDLFYTGRYSKSIKNFNKVKELYSQHPKAEEFIAAANERIKNGQDVKDFPILLVGGAVVVVVVGGGGAVILIKRHHQGHQAYKSHVATGGTPPLTKADPPQTVQFVPGKGSGSSWQQGLVAPTPVNPPSSVDQPK
ncbi:MAG: serine protease [Patescibacteria group bacterium]